MIRKALLGGVVGCATALGLAASPAVAAPGLTGTGEMGSLVLSGYCSFDVSIVYLDHEHSTTTTLPDGSTVTQVNGAFKAVVENVATGKTISYNLSGPGTFTTSPDGTVQAVVRGPYLAFTTPENSYPGVPTLSYTTGRVTWTVDPSGLTTSSSSSGPQTDVCAALS